MRRAFLQSLILLILSFSSTVLARESRKGVSCTTVLEGEKHSVAMTFRDNLLQIQKTSPTTHYEPVKHKLKPISFVQAPPEKPILKCEERKTTIIVWEKWVRVNAQYYEIVKPN